MKQPSTPQPAVVPATGWIADNWPAFADPAQPAVVVNPSASVGAVLAWCYGELASVSASATALACVDGGVSVDELSFIFRQRLEPAVRVMRAALDRLAERGGETAACAPFGSHTER